MPSASSSPRDGPNLRAIERLLGQTFEVQAFQGFDAPAVDGPESERRRGHGARRRRRRRRDALPRAVLAARALRVVDGGPRQGRDFTRAEDEPTAIRPRIGRWERAFVPSRRIRAPRSCGRRLPGRRERQPVPPGRGDREEDAGEGAAAPARAEARKARVAHPRETRGLKGTLRVIGGTLRGRRLGAPRGRGPTNVRSRARGPLRYPGTLDPGSPRPRPVRRIRGRRDRSPLARGRRGGPRREREGGAFDPPCEPRRAGSRGAHQGGGTAVAPRPRQRGILHRRLRRSPVPGRALHRHPRESVGAGRPRSGGPRRSGARDAGRGSLRRWPARPDPDRRLWTGRPGLLPARARRACLPPHRT